LAKRHLLNSPGNLHDDDEENLKSASCCSVASRTPKRMCLDDPKDTP